MLNLAGEVCGEAVGVAPAFPSVLLLLLEQARKKSGRMQMKRRMKEVLALFTGGALDSFSGDSLRISYR